MKNTFVSMSKIMNCIVSYVVPAKPVQMGLLSTIGAKMLVMIYHLWKKNEAYDSNYQVNIQKHKEIYLELLGLENDKKNSPNQVEAMQDKHLMKNHELLSFC